MNRRILLIDADPAFRASLAQRLLRYRFEIAVEPDAEQAIALAAETPPALVMVAVEEPDKAGFKVFQRCKKGALSKVPIVLMTASVSPDSFAKHRGLKVHADDYVDKRSTSDDELLGKIDALVGLGPPADDDLAMPLEVDEISLSSDDMVLEETVGEDDAGAGGAEPHVDSMVDAETDAAFAALLGDEASPRTPVEHVPPPAPAAPSEPAAPTAPDPPDPLPRRAARPRTSDEAANAAGTAVPAPVNDPGRLQDSGAVDFDTFSRESMRPPVDLIARARQDHLDHAASSVQASAVEAHESVPAIAIDVNDLEPVEDHVAGAPEPVQQQQQQPPPAEREVSKPRFLDVSTVVEPRPHVATAAVQAPASSYNTAPVPDLGLDAIAMPETTAEQSGVYDRRALRKIGELERQIAQVKTELDRARATADASARGANREREFLNLREQIIARDKDLHRVRDDLRARDRDLADAQDRLRDAEQARAAVEAHAAELGQQAAAEANRATTLEARGKAYAIQLAALQQELETTAHAATTAEAARVEFERDLGEERALRAASASDAERSLRVEREQLVARHQAELAALYDEAAAARESALSALQEELERNHAAAVAVAVAAARTEVAAQAEQAVGQLEARHGAELARRKHEHAAALAQLTGERDAAMAQIASERDAAVAAVEDEHYQQIARLQSERAAELAQVRDDAALQLSKFRDELTRQLAQGTQDAELRIAEAQAARDRAVAERAGELERAKHQLTAVRAENEQALGAAAAEHAVALDEQARRHKAEHAVALDEQARLHKAELARHAQAHAAARAQDAAAHDEARAAIAALRAELEGQASHHGELLAATRKDLDELTEQHEHAKGALIEQHRYAIDTLTQGHAAELADARDDKQRAIEGAQRAIAEARAAAERAVAQLRAELDAHTERAEREAAEHRTALLGAKRALDDAAQRHQAERDAAERDAAKRLEDQKAQHERAIALANGELVKIKAMADAEHGKAITALSAEHGKAIAALNADHERQRKDAAAQHAALAGELTSERDELRRGLSSARDSAKRSEAELATAVQTIADRNTELRAHAAAIAERDQRIAELRREFEALEQENANYQDQVLRAYQKIKTDEAMVARAKKAMAIALTVLDDQGNPKAEPT